jgi:hypothetical protein
VNERRFHVVRIDDNAAVPPQEIARLPIDADHRQPPAGFVVLGDTVVITHASPPVRVELFLHGRGIAVIAPATVVHDDVNATVVLPVAAARSLFVATIANVRDDSRRIVSFCRDGQVRRDTIVRAPFAIAPGRSSGSLSAVLASEPMQIVEYEVARIRNGRCAAHKPSC